MAVIRYKDFWDNFGGIKCSGEGYDKELKLKILNEWANKLKENLGYHNDKSWKVRCDFETDHKRRHTFEQYPLCFVCGEKAKVRHHIITISRGGTNNEKNLISLCKECHRKAHLRYKCCLCGRLAILKTAKENMYCRRCYEDGYEQEKIAMGYYECNQV